jgi:hypothetical protein
LHVLPWLYGDVVLLLASAGCGLPPTGCREDDTFVTDNIHSGWHIKRACTSQKTFCHVSKG